MLVRVYLDACCLSRLTDDQSQARVSTEAESIEAIMRWIRRDSVVWVSSTVLHFEVSRNPDPQRRREAEELLFFADEVISPNSAVAERARQIGQSGFSPLDALHLACAERANADAFLTVDDNLLRRAKRNPGLLYVRVENPVNWYKEGQL